MQTIKKKKERKAILKSSKCAKKSELLGSLQKGKDIKKTDTEQRLERKREGTLFSTVFQKLPK